MNANETNGYTIQTPKRITIAKYYGVYVLVVFRLIISGCPLAINSNEKRMTPMIETVRQQLRKEKRAKRVHRIERNDAKTIWFGLDGRQTTRSSIIVNDGSPGTGMATVLYVCATHCNSAAALPHTIGPIDNDFLHYH